MKITGYACLFTIVFSIVFCFKKPVKPDLPPEVLENTPQSDTTINEGETLLFQALAYDEKPLRKFVFLVDDSEEYSIAGDTLDFEYISTGHEGDHSYNYLLIDEKGDTLKTQPRGFSVVPHSFSIFSPEDNSNVGGSIFFKLINSDETVCHSISLLKDGKIVTDLEYKNNFIYDISEYTDNIHSCSLIVWDERKEELSSNSLSFKKVSDAIIELPDTLLSSETISFILPLKVINANNIYGLGIKVELFDKNIKITKVETSTLTKNPLAFNPQYLQNEVTVDYYANHDNYINGDGILFYFHFHLQGSSSEKIHIKLSKERAQSYDGITTKDLRLYTNDSFIQIK